MGGWNKGLIIGSYKLTPDGKRQCTRCKHYFPIEEFPARNKAKPHLKTSYCIECDRARQRDAYYGRNPVRNLVKMAKDDKKQCLDCKQYFPVEMFPPIVKHNPRRRRAVCPGCYKIRFTALNAEANRKTQSDPIKRFRRLSTRYKYHLTVEQYMALYTAQDGCCAICGLPPKTGGRNLHIDHDHETGVVRGLLCYRHNTALGHLESFIRDDLLDAAFDYLMAAKGMEMPNKAA